MRRHSHRALVAALLLVLLAALPAAASPAVDPVRVERERVLRYWTAERMASAIPRDFVRIPGGFAPAAKPPGTPGGGGGGGGGGGSNGNVTGKSWDGGGDVLKSTGKVYFRMGGTRYQCSGAVANDGNRAGYSLVLTAAHCAYDEVARAFATEWMFIPEWDSAPTSNCANTAHGCWNAAALVVHNGYATAGGFNTQATVHDYAFAVVGAGGKTASSNDQLDQKVPALGVTFNGVAGYSGISKGQKLYAFGYPAAGKYKGNDLVYCAGPIFEDPYNSELTWGMNCDMTGGSSGGPWLSSFTESSGSGTLSSVNSYGYNGVKAMHGPKFDGKTKAVWDGAKIVTSDTVVSTP
jgi:hypothetical protein